jgi:hypothetical protein
MAHNSKILNLQPFLLLWNSSISFPLCMCPSRMVLLNAKIGPLLRLSKRCLMSIGLLGVFGPKRSTSYELQFGRPLKVNHFRVFGCRCFVLKKGNLDKFESQSSDGVFMGYALHSHAYRVLNLETNYWSLFSDAIHQEQSNTIVND